uniref:Torsin family 3 member A n=1 Tax=Molossus molossus TaxID=27622 RepID=A0A7J8CV78_MOLMO|nr:torsin family 3 member A [Molossus molossus]
MRPRSCTLACWRPWGRTWNARPRRTTGLRPRGPSFFFSGRAGGNRSMWRMLCPPPTLSNDKWKNIFSNLGGNAINEVVLGLLQAGWSREEIAKEHLEARLQAEIVASTDSGFGHSRLVKEKLIDSFVPFLPLESRHVRLCARDAFLSQGLPYTQEALDEIAKMMVYVPKEEQLFSSQGCKSVSQRINYFLP